MYLIRVSSVTVGIVKKLVHNEQQESKLYICVYIYLY